MEGPGAEMAEEVEKRRVGMRPELGMGYQHLPRTAKADADVYETMAAQVYGVDGGALEAGGARIVSAEEAGVDKARFVMVQIDDILREVPLEQRTALLLNLLVMSIAEMPAAKTHRGKVINGMTEEIRKRLQKYLPLSI